MRSVFVFLFATLLVACVFAQQPNSVGSAQEFQFNSIKSMVSYFASKVEELPDQFPYTQEQCSTFVEVLRNQFSQFNRMDDKKRFFALELFKLVKHTPALVQQIESNPTLSKPFNYLLNKALPNLFNEYTGPYVSKAICLKIAAVYNKKINTVKGFVGVVEDSVERMTPEELNAEMATYISSSVSKVKQITDKKLSTSAAEQKPKKAEKKVEKKKESKKPKKTEEKPKQVEPKKTEQVKVEKKPKKPKKTEKKPKKVEEKPKPVEQKSNIVELKPEAPKLETVSKAKQVEQQKRDTIQKYLDLFSTFTHAANTTPMKMAQRLAHAYGQKKEPQQQQPKPVEKKPEVKPKKPAPKPKKPKKHEKKPSKKHEKKPKKTHVVKLVVKKKKRSAPKPKPKAQPKARKNPKTSIHEIMQETNSLLEQHNQELNSLLRSTGDLDAKDRRTHFDVEEHEDAEDDDDDDHEHKHDDDDK